MAAIGRLFVEIGAKSTLTEDLQKPQDSLTAFGEKATRSGRQFLSAFEAALNPTKRPAEELTLLEREGKSSGDILAVMGDEMDVRSEGSALSGRNCETGNGADEGKGGLSPI